MNGLLSLLLAGATLSGAVEEQAPKPKIDVSAQIYMPDGKASGASRRVELGTEPVVLYVYTGKTLCEARTVSAEKPIVAGNGWKVTLERVQLPAFTFTDRTGQPEASRPASGPLRVKASWQRLWENGRPLAGDAVRTTELLFTPGSVLPLDTIDGAARQVSRETSTRLHAWKPGDPPPPEFEKDGRISSLLDAIAGRQQDKMTLKSVSGFGNGHPRIVAIDSEIAAARKQVDERIQSLINATAASGSAGPSVVDGCAALSMNLQVGIEKPGSFSPVTETELWLIHRDPSGKETEQRQVVRSRESSGEYFFDDVKIQTEKGPVTIEIYGSVHESMTGEGGEPWLLLDVRRRYITTGPRTPQQLVFPAYTWKTKEGNTSYRQTIHQNEVVSFQLLPLPDDEGALSGHRFSVRVRMRVLQ